MSDESTEIKKIRVPDLGTAEPGTRRRADKMDAVLEGAHARLEDTVDAISQKRNTPRNKDIRQTLRILERVWLTFPQLRLSQLLSISIPAEELERRNNDIFYFEDDEMIRWLNEFHNKNFRAPTKARRR